MHHAPQWINWRLAQVTRKGKPITIKLPISPLTGTTAETTNPATWGTYEQAKAAGDRVGFVFTEDDPYWLLDIDHALTDGQWSPLALELCAMFPDSYLEKSQSGTGLHIIGSGKLPDHRCKNIALGIELYHWGRFVALTGDHARGSADAVVPAETLAALVDKYFKPAETINNVDAASLSTAPRDDWDGFDDDDELIAAALKSKPATHGFTTSATFADLWNCNEDVLAECYPSEDDVKPFDGSSADAALAQHLAFWTGCHGERIEVLMHRSGLSRAKYDRPDYMLATVNHACRLQRDVHRRRPEAAPYEPPPMVQAAPAHTGADVAIRSGFQFLDVTSQIEHFRGCCYVIAAHRVFTPTGQMLKSEQFNAQYGGFEFQMNDDGRKTTKKAFEVFTESQCASFPKAHDCTFEPQHPPGAIIERDGLLLVNTYVPVKTPSVPGDVGPFVAHVERLLPDARDRSILFAYMAAVVQHKGVKFQWCPLIQGAPGNGKTLITRVLEQAVGERYTHLPSANDLDEKFNAWLFNKIFIGIEDVYVPAAKIEVMERLKPMITNRRLKRRAMQQDEVTAAVCANFVLNSNHKDGIRKDDDDRRFAVFYTAQQSSADILRDGMSGRYFPDLYAWLDAGGYAHVTHWLESYAIPDELNPATTCTRAPETSSTRDAIAASRGSIEQEVEEAIAQGRPGFAGGWVSSTALAALLAEVGRGRTLVPLNKRRDMMQSLGYVYHPALPDGRVTRVVIPDGNKPRLYIREGHPAGSLGASDALDHYEAQQAGRVNDHDPARAFSGS